jgi:hypothetical protein
MIDNDCPRTRPLELNHIGRSDVKPLQNNHDVRPFALSKFYQTSHVPAPMGLPQLPRDLPVGLGSE